MFDDFYWYFRRGVRKGKEEYFLISCLGSWPNNGDAIFQDDDLSDGEEVAFEVDTVPGQPQQLTAAAAKIEGQDVGGIESVGFRGLQEFALCFRCEDRAFFFLANRDGGCI